MSARRIVLGDAMWGTMGDQTPAAKRRRPFVDNDEFIGRQLSEQNDQTERFDLTQFFWSSATSNPAPTELPG